MLPALRPFFRDDWVQYGESLQLRDADCLRPSVAQWLSDPEHLDAAIIRHAETLNGACDRKAVASDWMLRYLDALLPPIVALASFLDYRVPTSSHDMALVLNESGVPVVFEIAHLGRHLPGAGTATRYDALVWQHLEPLITYLARRTKVPAKILRGNVRRALLGIFGHALQLAGANPVLSAALIKDRELLLESPTWSDGRRNPLFLRHRQIRVPHQGGERLLTLHASCCLAYRLPHTEYCEACPLVPEHHRSSLS